MISERDEVTSLDTIVLTNSIVDNASKLQEFCYGDPLPVDVKRLLIELEYKFAQDVQTIILETLKR